MYEKGWSQQQVDECDSVTYNKLLAMHSLVLERQRMAANRG